MPMSEESLNTAFRLHRAGDLAGAAGLYGAVWRADPANAQAHYLLGFVHFQRGEFSNAEKRLGEALKLNPVSLDALYNRGSALMKLNRHVEALASFDLLLQINPTIAEAWAARGKALLDRHRYGEALASFDTALRFGNDQVGTWTNRGTALADLFLDMLPYNAHTTASDALWAGVPVLTCLGSTFAGRVAASLNNAIGVPEMVTYSLGEYEALALKFAREPAALWAIRAKLAKNRNTFPLFDTVGFTRGLEAAYRTMWERANRGETPASFAVERGR
jgi:tetratricopeptide (TPR) repeat protein